MEHAWNYYLLILLEETACEGGTAYHLTVEDQYIGLELPGCCVTTLKTMHVRLSQSSSV